MNKQRYIALLQDPSALTKADIPDIEELITQFPYCQNAHILLAKIQNELGSMHAAKLTRKAALYTSDRTKLKRLLVPKTSVKNNFAEERNVQLLIDETITAPEFPSAPIINEVAEIPERTDAAPVPVVEQIENILTTPINIPVVKNIKNEADKHANNFLTELEENLKALHESKARAAGLFKEDTKKTVEKVETAKLEVPLIEEEVKTEFTSLVEIPTPSAFSSVIEEQKTIQAQNEITEKDFFSALDDISKADGLPKKSYSALLDADIPKKDVAKGNDVLDLILSFDNRVKDYFDINEYATKNPTDSIQEEHTVTQVPLDMDTTIYQLPFNNLDWKLEESRLEEQGPSSYGLLLDYLEYLKDQKNKKQKPDKKREKTIISRFIQKDPMISPLTYSKSHSEDENSNESSNNQDKPVFVSETFAKLLEKQGKIIKAIAVYEELILKNPEKNSYFASLIQELKKKL